MSNRTDKINLFSNVKSKYILQQIFDNLKINKALNVIRNNKFLLNKLEKDINDYKKYLEVEIEIETKDNVLDNFINIKNECESLYHFYIDDSKEETKLNDISNKDKAKKIKIIIDYDLKFLDELFANCKNITKISFLKFNRRDIISLSHMFSFCESLQELNISAMKTDNVVNMNNLFAYCYSLKKLNLSNFITKNVSDMHCLFYRCELLEELNLSNFDTQCVTVMSCMFYECKNLQKLNIANFNTENATDMSHMFYRCYSLLDLDVSKFNTNKAT